MSWPTRYDRYEKNKSQSQAKQGAIKKSPASAQVDKKWHDTFHLCEESRYMLNLISQSPAARPTVTEAPLIDFSSPQVNKILFCFNRQSANNTEIWCHFQTLGATSEPASLAPSLANFKVLANLNPPARKPDMWILLLQDDDAANLANWIGEENVEKPETTQVLEEKPTNKQWCFTF